MAKTYDLTARLRLKEELSGRMKQAVDAVKKFGQTGEVVSATWKRVTGVIATSVDKVKSKVMTMGNTAQSHLDRLGGSSTSLAGKIMGVVAALGLMAGAAAGIKATIGGAFQLEQEQIAMEHFIALKDPGNAKSKTNEFIAYLRQNANVTPFETGEVIAAGRRAVNIAGGDTTGAKKMVVLAENMAALNPGKSINDAMEALADLKVGETERMKEFGFKISQADLKKAGGGNASTGAQKMMDGDISTQFKGGADKLSSSGTGLMSTITGAASSALTDMGIQAAEKLKPMLQKIADFVSGDAIAGWVTKGADMLTLVVEKGIQFADWLKVVVPQVIAFGDKIGGWVNVITAVAGAIATFNIVMTVTKAVLMAMSISAQIAAGGITAVVSPIILIALAIAAAVALLYLAWKNNWGGIREKTAVVVEWLVGAFKWIVEAGKIAWQAIKDGWQMLVGVWNYLKGLFQQFIQWIQPFVDYWMSIWPLLVQAFKIWIMPIIEVIWLVIQVVWAAIQVMWIRLVGGFQIMWALVSFYLTMVWQTVKLAFLTIWDIIKVYLQLVWDIIVTVWTFISGIFKAFLQLITGDFAGAWATFKQTISDTLAMVWKTLTDFVGGMIDVGKNFINNIIQGFLNVWGDLKKTAQNIWDSITGIFKGSQKVQMDFEGTVTKHYASDGAPVQDGQSRASGLAYVPYDGYQATLHKGERILTPEEATAAKSGGRPIVISGNNFTIREEADIEKVARALARILGETGGLMANG